jgi:hypothetical protein
LWCSPSGLQVQAGRPRTTMGIGATTSARAREYGRSHSAL